MANQLYIKEHSDKKNIFPKNYIDNIRDKESNKTLTEILQGFNCYFLSYTGNVETTRLQVPKLLRKQGLWITYVDYKNNTITEYYDNPSIEDSTFKDSSNWREGNNRLVGDLSISANGNWVINGVETKFKAQGETGETPLLRYYNNILQASYNKGNNWGDIASFTNNLGIHKYVSTKSELPNSASLGTIYAVGPETDEEGNDYYRLYTYAYDSSNTLKWVDNGLFKGITAGIVNDLTTGGADKALSAEMGQGLNAKINILVYPYVDMKLNIYYDSSNKGLFVDFTGFNVKFGNKSYNKTKAVVISEVGQSGENLVIPEGNGLIFNTSSATFEIIQTYVPEVRETKILILSHHNNGHLNYIHPCLSEYVYTNKISAVRKEVSDLQEVVATHDKAIETLDKRLISDVELGTISDNNGQDLVRTNRMRTIGYLNRENYRGVTIRGTSAIHIWTMFYDKNFNFINTRPDKGWLWATNLTGNEIDTLPENIAYLRLVFTKPDESDITEEDVTKIQDVLSTIYPEQRVTQLELQTRILGTNIFANISPDNVYIKGNSVFFKPNGFGIRLKRTVYWIADASRTKTEDYVYTLSTNQDLLVIDTSALSKIGSRNELSDVIKKIQIYEANTGYDYTRYIPLFYYYNKIFPLGDCKDIFFPESEPKSDSELTHQYINNEILFSPEFYAYAQGRYNDNNGVGTGWYKRFSLLHISDTHQYNALVKESLSVGNEKVAAIVNTGDDANGGSPEIIKNELNATAATITSNCSIPYIGCNGNHDVPEITKKEYWDIMCSVINNKTSIVWGDADGYRTYGYADFTSDDYEGNYRIIMLDPFDYDDGMYGATYTWQSAVFSQKQIDWLIESLLDAANKGYHVLTAMHYSFGDNTLQFNDKLAKPDAKFYQDAFMIPDIIDAIQNKLVLNRNYLDEKGVNNITINRDFTNVGNLNFIAHLFGHIHSKNEYRCQKTDGSKKYDMLMLGEATLGAYGNALNKAYKKSGTINEIAFSALEIDPIEKCIYRVAYGSYLNYDKSNSERTVKISYRFNRDN